MTLNFFFCRKAKSESRDANQSPLILGHRLPERLSCPGGAITLPAEDRLSSEGDKNISGKVS